MWLQLIFFVCDWWQGVTDSWIFKLYGLCFSLSARSLVGILMAFYCYLQKSGCSHLLMKVNEKWCMSKSLFYKIRYSIANSSGSCLGCTLMMWICYFIEVVSLLNNLIRSCLRLLTGSLCMRRNLLTRFAYNYMKIILN
jgi:hypothetical protein